MFIDGMRRYGLAVACIAGPLLLGYALLGWTVAKLVPERERLFPIEYRFADAQPMPDPADGKPVEAAVKAESGTSKADAATSVPLSKTALRAKDVAGSFGFAVASLFVYLAAVGAFSFAAAIVFQRLGWHWLLAAVLIFGVIALNIASTAGPYGLLRPLLIDDLLNAADAWPTLVPLALKGGTGPAVFGVIKFNTFVGLLPVGLLLVAFAALAIRPANKSADFADLQWRLIGIRWALILGSAILVAAVLANKALREWGLGLLAADLAADLRPVGNTLTLLVGASGTAALLCAGAPAVAAWLLDAALLPAESESDAATSRSRGPSIDAQLLPKPLTSLTAAIVATLAPLIASPLADVLAGAAARA